MPKKTPINSKLDPTIGEERQKYSHVVKQPRQIDALKYKDDLVPISSLFAKPSKSQVKISGSGKYLAWISGRNDVGRSPDGSMNIYCKDLENDRIKQLTFSKDRDACSYFIFNADETEILFLREIRRGSETYHLFALEILPFFDFKTRNNNEGFAAKPRNLIEDPKTTCGIGFIGGIQLWVYDGAPREVYVSTATIGPFSLFWDISRINIDTKECVLVKKNVMSSFVSRWHFILQTGLALLCSKWIDIKKSPTVPIQWFPDNDMQFRGCIEIDLVNLGAYFCARGRNEQAFKMLHSCTFEDSNMELLGSSGGAGTARMDFSRSYSDGDTVDVHLCALTGKLASDTTTYDRFNITTGEHVSRVAGGCEQSDITGFVSNPITGRPQFITYNWEKPAIEVLFDGNDARADDLEYIESYFSPSMVFSIVSSTNNNGTWIIYAEADCGQEMCGGSPGGYFLFNRSSSHERSISLIFPSRPELSGHLLGNMEPLCIPASDGEKILCYLSEPPNEKCPETPLVLMIHGGPQARDVWGFNPFVQLLCSRGFRVLQVNYRGSTGFGSRFIQMGMNGEFCKTLQQDITDAAKYAINKGLCAKDRLGIIGGSFGGFSSLFGLTFQPDLYKCSVAICPLTSVGAADEESKKSFSGSPLVKKYHEILYGEKVSKIKKCAMDVSPLYNTDSINKKVSVAIFHGEDDPRAPIGHSRKFVEEMKKRGISGEFVSFSGEGHGISKEENRLFMYNRIEKFLCRKFNLPTGRDEDDKFANNSATVEWSNT